MSEFLTKVRIKSDEILDRLRIWDEEESAKKVMRRYLSEQGMLIKQGSKLDELLNARHKLALGAEDEHVRLKAIDSALTMAAGSEKVTNVQNNQFNFGEFVNGLKE